MRLFEASGPGASFKHATITLTDFYGAELNNADFTGATVSGSRFTRAKLKVEQFANADFTNNFLPNGRVQGTE